MARLTMTGKSRGTAAKLMVRLKQSRRCYSDQCGEGTMKKGVVLGAYDGCNLGEFKLTQTGQKFDEEVGGKLKDLLKGANLKRGKAQVFTNLSGEFYGVAVAHAGKEEDSYSQLEKLDVCKENIRTAAGVGAMALQDRGINNILVEGMKNSECAAEGASLGIWRFQDQKRNKAPNSKIDLFEDPDREGWQKGIVKADAQNIARRLEETPANLMTPSIFAQRAIDILCPCGVTVDVRDKDWIESKKMFSFLSVAKGSCEQPLFLELGYCAGPTEDKPVVMAGKGVTFDSGGVCLKQCKGMEEYRADMAGAAVVVGVVKAISSMLLPLNVNCVIPVCENMMGGMSIKPGDVVLGINGKTIRIENTGHEGRVILADALAYTIHLRPCLVLSLATLSRATRRSLGSSATACFTSSDMVWREMERAGEETGDRFWRLPIWKHFSSKVTSYIGVDVNNVGKGDGDACLAAAFLNEFFPSIADYAHLDITGTGMLSSGIGYPYLKKGLMTGRPVRTVVQFLYQMACPHEKSEDCQ